MNERGCQAVGIDLGTTYSSLAYLDAQLVPRVVADSNGQTVIPSAVFFDDDEIIVGDIALQQSKLRADRVVQFVKVHMGDEWRHEVNGQVHTPESVSAIVLAHLVREAELQLGPITNAVVTVPAYFTEKRRRATQQAGEIAGLTVIGTLNEPTAAALAYGLHHEQKEQIVLVYDLGGGTFDVTIVRISPNELEELVTCGNRQLGGKDWDECLVNFVADDFLRRTGADPRSSVQAMQDLWLECERAKRRLSRMTKTSIRLNAFGHELICELTREQFESLTAHLLHTTKLTVEMALEDAGLSWDRITKVLLVGGSTHMPMTRAMLKEMAGYPPDTGINPVAAVALGAATYAHILETGQGPRTLLHAGEPDAFTADQPAPVLDTTVVSDMLPVVHFVTAHGVGVKAKKGDGWANVVLIPKNTRVPCSVGRRFYTNKRPGATATRIRIDVTQGDTENLELAEFLGTATIAGLPPNERTGQPVKITMRFDEQGRLQLHAIYVNTGQDLKLALEIPGGLQEADVEQYRQLMVETGLISHAGLKVEPDAIPLLEEDDGEDEILTLEPW